LFVKTFMRMLLGICLLGLVSLWAENEWERVYPESPFTKEDVFLLDIASRVIPDGSNAQEYLAVGHGGKVVYGKHKPESTEIDWRVVQLPMNFDIRSVCVVEDKWMIGGTRGHWARYTGPMATSENQSIDDLTSDLHNGWSQSILPQVEFIDPSVPIDRIVEKDGTILVLMGFHKLAYSTDKGRTWRSVILDTTGGLQDLAVFKGHFYAVTLQYDQFRILRSSGGTAWSFHKFMKVQTDYCEDASLMLIAEEHDESGRPIEGSERLYVGAEFSNWSGTDRKRLLLSTKDGQTWVDNGSQQQTDPPDGPISDWNPLFLKEHLLDQPFPGCWLGKVTGDIRLLNLSVSQRDGEGWKELWNTPSVSAIGQHMAAERISVWDELVFVSPRNTIVSIGPNGDVLERSVPDFGSKFVEWNQLLHAKEGWFGHVDLWDADEWLYETLHPALGWSGGYYGTRILLSSELPDWQVVDESNGWLRPLKPFANRIGQAYLTGGRLNDLRPRQFVWEGEWVERGFDYYPWVNEHQQTYNDRLGWVHIRNSRTGSDELYSIHDSEGGTIAQIIPMDSNSDRSWRIASLNGEDIILYGTHSEIAFVSWDGSRIRQANLASFGISTIENAAFANGWYYIFGDATVRTKDFVDFEVFEWPENTPLVHVVPFEGDLYAFSRDAVYRRPMDRGYLDSVIGKQNWRQSDWLGWFLLLNHEKGIIYHLLLGNARVLFANKQQYWLNTSTLGWIYIYKDWAPWFWRMDDGHWYWLDQDGWPPRAWDYDDQEWVELRP
jgi:hypothetical protein